MRKHELFSGDERPGPKRREPFPFVLEELEPIRPTIKHMFGFTSVYLEEKLLCSLRDSVKQPGSNGMWLYTTKEHLDSLAKEFPDLPRRQLWRSRNSDKAWIILASRLETFEEYAFKACELILAGDRRIGRLKRLSLQTLKAATRRRTPN